MCCGVGPGSSVTAECVLRRAIDVGRAGDNSQDDSENDDDLSRQVQEHRNHQKLLVAAEAAGMNTHGVIQDSNSHERGDADPFCR